jgi:hypothetical protein
MCCFASPIACRRLHNRNGTRTPNEFSVTATTALGGSTVQSWMVVPDGVVYGTNIDTFWTTTGFATRTRDLSPGSCPSCAFAALVPQADGSIRVLQGTGRADGTFVIPDVPAGYYWLQTSLDPQQLFWTNTSTFDMGRDFVGRLSNTMTMAFDFRLFGLDVWEMQDSLRITSPSAGPGFSPTATPPLGATSFTDSEQLVVHPIKAQGDATFVLQNEPLKLPTLTGQVLGPALVLPELEIDPSGTTTITGVLTSSQTQFDLEFSQSDWASQFRSTGPTVATLSTIVCALSAQPIVIDKKASPSLVLFQATGPLRPDQQYGTLYYNDPFPIEWPRVLSVLQTATVQVPIPNAGAQTLPVSSGYETISPSSRPGPPLISPVVLPTINGFDFFAATTTTNSTAITLRWFPPTGLVASAYVVEVFRLATTNGAQYYVGPIAILHSAKTELVIPATLLLPASTYVFSVQARTDAGNNIETSPGRSGYPSAWADAISGSVTVVSN